MVKPVAGMGKFWALRRYWSCCEGRMHGVEGFKSQTVTALGGCLDDLSSIL